MPRARVVARRCDPFCRTFIARCAAKGVLRRDPEASTRTQPRYEGRHRLGAVKFDPKAAEGLTRFVSDGEVHVQLTRTGRYVEFLLSRWDHEIFICVFYVHRLMGVVDDQHIPARIGRIDWPISILEGSQDAHDQRKAGQHRGDCGYPQRCPATGRAQSGSARSVVSEVMGLLEERWKLESGSVGEQRSLCKLRDLRPIGDRSLISSRIR